MTRREFLKLASLSAGALGLTALDLSRLEEALAKVDGPNVIWLQGASCTGCSVSFLNRIATSAPTSAADVLINLINLRYHPQLMAVAGQSAAEQARAAYDSGNFILAVEGGVPTAFGGHACSAWTYNGQDVTLLEAVKSLAPRAKAVLSIGTCASFGGIAAAPPNSAAVKSVAAATGVSTINIAGCPVHPDWIVWAIAQLLAGKTITRDSYGRPTALYGRTVHDQCPRRSTDETERLGVEGRCLKELGCRGPETRCSCPSTLFNGRVNWCIGANAPCTGCTEPSFSGTSAFYEHVGGGGGGIDDD
ncbi:MAG: hydrogenase small subunit [Armatimonadia bacterium]